MSIDWNAIFSYNNGVLYWKISPSARIKEGMKAGNKTGPGYWQICYKGSFYKLHRIIWEMFNGEIASGMEIDHKDRDLDNNDIDNLRIVTRNINAFNRGVQNNSSTGVKGVSKYKNKFVAYIRVNQRTVNLGYFDTIEEASTVYQEALDYFSNL